MPWPVTDREQISISKLIYIKSMKVFVLSVRSIDETSLFNMNTPEETAEHVRVEMKRGFHVYKRLNDDETLYYSLGCADVKLKHAPAFLVNFLIEKI